MDRRQAKTRQAVFRAFTGLLERKSYGSITVQEIRGNVVVELLNSIFGGDTPEATVYYSAEKVLTKDNFKTDGTTENPTFTDAGNYTVYYYVDSGNYEPSPMKGSQTVEITPATLTVTADANQSKTYGDTDPALTYKVTGFQGSDTESVRSGALSRKTGEDAGTYAINQGTLRAGKNYTISFTGADFTINPKALTVTAKPKEIVYGEAPANDGVTYSGFANGDDAGKLNGTLSYTYS